MPASPYRSPAYQRRRLALALMGYRRTLRLRRVGRGLLQYWRSDLWAEAERVALNVATGAVWLPIGRADTAPWQLDAEFARFLDGVVRTAGQSAPQLNAGNPRPVPARELADVLTGLSVLGWRQRTRWHGVGYVVTNGAVEASVWPIGGRITVSERYRPPPPLFVTERHALVWRIEWLGTATGPHMQASFAPSIRRAAQWQGTARRAGRRRP